MPTELSGQIYRVFRYETLFLNFCSAEEFMLEKSLRPWNKSVQLDLQLTSVSRLSQVVTQVVRFYSKNGRVFWNFGLYTVQLGSVLHNCWHTITYNYPIHCYLLNVPIEMSVKVLIHKLRASGNDIFSKSGIYGLG